MGWLIALAILVLLAILPLGAKAVYCDSGFYLWVIAGPVRIPILPAKKKEKKPSGEKQEKAAPDRPEPQTPPAAQPDQPEKKKDGPLSGGSVTDFLPLVKTALDLLGAFRRKLRVNRLELKLVLAGGDPCDLAVNYGRGWAAVGNLMPLLEKCFVIRKRDVQVECDFVSDKTTVFARLDITITLGRLVALAVVYGVRALVQLMKINKNKKGGSAK